MPNGTKLPQPSSFDYVCEWNTCRIRFLTARELLTHVEEDHIGRLPVRMSGLRRSTHALICHWRNCPDACKVFAARYKLLLHVQQCHCREKVQKSNVSLQCVHNTFNPLCTQGSPSTPCMLYTLSSVLTPCVHS